MGSVFVSQLVIQKRSMKTKETKTQTHDTEQHAKRTPNSSEKPNDDEPNVNTSALQFRRDQCNVCRGKTEEMHGERKTHRVSTENGHRVS